MSKLGTQVGTPWVSPRSPTSDVAHHQWCQGRHAPREAGHKARSKGECQTAKLAPRAMAQAKSGWQHGPAQWSPPKSWGHIFRYSHVTTH